MLIAAENFRSLTPRFVAKSSDVAPAAWGRMPSMSLGLIPASSIARMQAVNCRERLLIPDLREYVVSPMPTIAALSLNSLVSYT